jgi:ferredoxin
MPRHRDQFFWRLVRKRRWPHEQFCRFTECVAVCPVECFHADEERTYIDPEVCIDCSACIPACPVRAIYEVIDIPDDQRHWIEINAERSHALPVMYAKQDPLPTAAARSLVSESAPAMLEAQPRPWPRGW